MSARGICLVGLLFSAGCNLIAPLPAAPDDAAAGGDLTDLTRPDHLGDGDLPQGDLPGDDLPGGDLMLADLPHGGLPDGAPADGPLPDAPAADTGPPPCGSIPEGSCVPTIRPLRCSAGLLVQDCGTCGCPGTSSCSSDNKTCITSASVTLPLTADTHTDSWFPEVPQKGQAQLLLGTQGTVTGSGVANVYLAFGLWRVPAEATIVAAQLTLAVESASTGTSSVPIIVKRVAQPWSDAELTHALPPAVSSTAAISTTLQKSGAPLDLTSLVAACAANRDQCHGIKLESKAAPKTYVKLANGSSSSRPSLTVTYQVPAVGYPSCGSVLHGHCSAAEPGKACVKGQLQPSCQLCGCPPEYVCDQSGSCRAPLVLSPVADTWDTAEFKDAVPTDNTLVRVGHNWAGDQRGYFDFGLNSLGQGTEVVRAVLTLTIKSWSGFGDEPCDPSNPGFECLYLEPRLVTQPWSEASLTYNNSPQVMGSTSNNLRVHFGSQRLDATTLSQQCVTLSCQGLRLHRDPALIKLSVYFGSRENSDGAARPRLKLYRR